ncbi:MAG TPA: nuclear transport factor 2 family protein [Actinomycetes bacterium]|nr:nuclear transport factor 2 family protein [Actinomycetes bacterium]
MADELAAATARVRDYLRLCEQRELEAAQAFLSPDAVLVFPGARRYTTVAAMVAEAPSRYRAVAKEILSEDAWRREHGDIGVVTTGVLAGVDVHGRAFAGVRFVDMFVLRDGLIVEQHVWNDLADLGHVPVLLRR